ncbi:MAG: hypothetical protein R6V62_10855, partial [Candidatus Fermentibacteraceae bacterium]
MRAFVIHGFASFIALLQPCCGASGPAGSGGAQYVPCEGPGVDHTCGDLQAIPAQWIDAVQGEVKLQCSASSR